MANIAIITDEPGWHGQQLTQAFLKRGYQSHYVSLTECEIQLTDSSLPIIIKGFEQNFPDAVFVRGIPGGSLQEVVFYLDILHALTLLNIPVYNDALAIERSVDKGMTSFLLKQARLSTPPTWVLHNAEVVLNLVKQQLKQGHTLISKPLFGSQGEGLQRIENLSDLFWLQASNGIYYLQRFITCLGEGFSDSRVLVINGKAVAAMRRCGISWLTNIAQGARGESMPLTPILADLAIKAAAALNMDYAGVDIIQDQQGQYFIIEVNSIPAWKGLESVCNLNIAQLLVDNLLDRYSLCTV
jgi:RimK family alpha-L-glutamate ligase